ncbi:MAG: hypothetical protein H7238_03450 [Polaromonas sp.]|nr:hypothetical protein [Polaromonas sp.]
MIVTLFIEKFLGAHLKWLAGTQFIASMISVIASLFGFLAEVYCEAHLAHRCSFVQGLMFVRARIKAVVTETIIQCKFAPFSSNSSATLRSALFCS